MTYEMDPQLGMFLKGPGRFQEAIERRAERVNKSASAIAEAGERRLERRFEEFQLFKTFMEIMDEVEQYGLAPDGERWPKMTLEIKKKLGQLDRWPWTSRDGVPVIGGGSISSAYSLVTGTVFSAATGAKTLINSIAPAGHGLCLCHFDVCFDSVTTTDVPATLDVVNSTQGAAGTSGVTPTITQVRGRGSGGSAPTGGSNYTAEPTTLVNLRKLYIPQLMGTYTFDFPLGREFECDSSGGTLKALALRVNTSATRNVLGNMEVEAVG